MGLVFYFWSNFGFTDSRLASLKYCFVLKVTVSKEPSLIVLKLITFSKACIYCVSSSFFLVKSLLSVKFLIKSVSLISTFPSCRIGAMQVLCLNSLVRWVSRSLRGFRILGWNVLRFSSLKYLIGYGLKVGTSCCGSPSPIALKSIIHYFRYFPQ